MNESAAESNEPSAGAATSYKPLASDSRQMGVDEATDDSAVIQPVTDRSDTSDTSATLTSGSSTRLARQQKRRRRRGSDPEDIFNPQPGDDDEDTDDAGSYGSDGDEEALAAGPGAAQRRS